MDWFGKISSRVTSGNNQRMNWFGKINSGESLIVGQSGNELIWENKFWGYLWLGIIREGIDLGKSILGNLWLGTSRERTDLGKSVLGLPLIGDNQRRNWFGKINSGESLIGDNQGMNWFGKISFGVISDWDYFSLWGQSGRELIWVNQLDGGTIWLQKIDLGDGFEDNQTLGINLNSIQVG